MAKNRRDDDEEDERPRSRRRDDEDEEDERPRKKRRDEEEDEDERPRKKRRRDDEDDDFDDYDSGRRGKLSRETLRSIATYQRAIMLCILGQFAVLGAFLLVPPDVKIFVQLALIPLGVTATVFVFMLSTKVYDTTTGVILGILTLVPLIGLIALLAVNGKATGVLKAHGIHVGLLGADSSDI